MAERCMAQKIVCEWVDRLKRGTTLTEGISHRSAFAVVSGDLGYNKACARGYNVSLTDAIRRLVCRCEICIENGGEYVEKWPLLAPQIHLSSHHHSHRDNVTATTGRPNFRSRLHFSHSRGGDHEV